MSAANDIAVERGLRELAGCLPQVVEDTLAICRVPAPTFEEAERGRFVAERMRALGLGTPYVDATGNVISELPGPRAGDGVLLSAHLDTVFGREIPIAARRDGDRLYGPGIGDNSLAVAAMLWLARALTALPERRTLIVAANVGEEGLGDLCGAKALWQAYGRRARAWVAIEGALGVEAVDRGVASRRMRIGFRTLGGHSWRDFGRPSAVHALGKLVAQIATVSVPKHPKTTYNVGGIEGGTSINTIAPTASLLLDMRSEDPHALSILEATVRDLVAGVSRAESVVADVEILGDRPGGALANDHWLRRLVDDAAGQTGLSLRWKAASTDANVPLSQGMPAVTLGIAEGHNLHSVEEVIDLGMATRGLELNYRVLATLLIGEVESA